MRKWFVRSLIALLGFGIVASAAAVSSPSPTAGQGLEISPPVQELTADPGQSLVTSVRVRNITAGELFVTGQVDDFGAGKNEDGSPHILPSNSPETSNSLKDWIPSVPNLTLAPQELKNVVVTINVPKNAEPGGHYGVVRFSGVPPELQGTGVSLSASVGSLLLVRVSGAIKDSLSVAQFTTGKSQNSDQFKTKSFFEYGPVDFMARISNTGSVHEKPYGSIEIKNLLGSKVATISINASGGNVLPGSIRKYTTTFSSKRLFGYYSAHLDMTYLDGKQKLSANTSFWVLPWKAILLTIVLIIALFFVLRWAIKRYNAYVIAQARKR